MQTPTVGRAVHYVSYGTPGGEFQSVCRAATITATNASEESDLEGQPEGTVSLEVHNPRGTYFNHAVPYSEENKVGTWHWPDRV